MKSKMKNLVLNTAISFLVTVFTYFIYARVIDIKTAEMFTPVIFLLAMIYLEISNKK